MANNKKEIFCSNSQKIADFAKAISHPARIEILRILAEKNSCICGEIVLEIPLAQSTVSQHLKELKSAGLISGIIEGPRSCYCLNVEGIAEMSVIFGEFFSLIKIENIKCNC
ncbi:MAG TPA: metalloregulator ArsR/SmtB family transcription factor [Spirochaetota bacterium]|nr:metalloregulator ArsR/SmtB family transcription factor [Spirochaetota bacterium]HPS86849.1 metalloregulator ArsR/SmtB family transcription factor [Spirochaetota bacterium]